jgi:hypothetical protein
MGKGGTGDVVTVTQLMGLRTTGTSYEVTVRTANGVKTVVLRRLVDQVQVFDSTASVVLLTSITGDRYIVRSIDNLDRKSRRILYLLT